ncbi:type II toxin-antitoxin system Phd/YefM family antitoxin [Microbacterium suaedae]|uniref:type II toxin-antitoxin system Phd/YefM family antitoxin n=1 Tax=Microbacterium suaedae TaxID=2067813 RepID=UPI000DA210C7|nr:prevent-host-death protein [Microbacterium suaedae]
MRSVTATSASRGFSELLSAVEHGDVVTIMRGGRAVAELRPVERHTLAALRSRLPGEPVFDDEMATSIAEATSLLTNESTDPWDDD